MSGEAIHTYETPDGPIDVFEAPGNTVVLRSQTSGEAIQICHTAADIADWGLDPAPLLSILGQAAIEKRISQRKAAIEARADLSDVLTGRIRDFVLGIDGVSVTVTLTVGSCLELADLVRGAR